MIFFMLNQLFSTHVRQERLDLALLILRLAVGGLMLTHGYPKLQMILSGKSEGFPDPLGVGSSMSLYLTVFAELICSVLLIFGLWTRFALLGLIICMAVAVFKVHFNDPLDKKEAGLLYLLPYITLWLSGPGRLSLDNKMLKY